MLIMKNKKRKIKKLERNEWILCCFFFTWIVVLLRIGRATRSGIFRRACWCRLASFARAWAATTAQFVLRRWSRLHDRKQHRKQHNRKDHKQRDSSLRQRQHGQHHFCCSFCCCCFTYFSLIIFLSSSVLFCWVLKLISKS